MNSSVVLIIVLFDSKGIRSFLLKILETNSSLEKLDKPYESMSIGKREICYMGFYNVLNDTQRIKRL